MISRATFTYVVMLAVFGAGLWAILSFGSILLRAPEDLAGKWELSNPQGSRPEMKMNVEQSGRFFKITIGSIEFSLKLRDETDLPDRRLPMKRVRLEGSSAKAEFEGRAGGDEFELRLSSPIDGNWIARRIERTYPKPETARSAKKASSTAPSTGSTAAAAANARP